MELIPTFYRNAEPKYLNLKKLIMQLFLFLFFYALQVSWNHKLASLHSNVTYIYIYELYKKKTEGDLLDWTHYIILFLHVTKFSGIMTFIR